MGGRVPVPLYIHIYIYIWEIDGPDKNVRSDGKSSEGVGVEPCVSLGPGKSAAASTLRHGTPVLKFRGRTAADPSNTQLLYRDVTTGRRLYGPFRARSHIRILTPSCASLRAHSADVFGRFILYYIHCTRGPGKVIGEFQGR